MTQSRSYEVIVDPAAFEKIKGVPHQLIDMLQQHIESVSESPGDALRPAPAPPYAWGGPISAFHKQYEEGMYYFTLFWLYGSEEMQLSLLDVTMSPCYKPKADADSDG